MEERVSYSEMRSWLFDCYYNLSRSKLIVPGTWDDGELEIGYAYDQYFNAFDTVLEKVMLEVLAIILAAGRLPHSEPFHRDAIAELLKNTTFDNLLNEVPADEKEEFMQDLKILNLV